MAFPSRSNAICLALILALVPGVGADPGTDLGLDPGRGTGGTGDLETVIDQLLQSQDDLRSLVDQGQIGFASPSASQRFARARRRIETAVQALEDLSGGGLPGDNFRGRTVVTLQQNLSGSHAQAAIARLPSFLSEDDYGFVDNLSRKAMGSQVAGLLGAYWTQPSDRHRLNRRGAAGKAVVDSLMTSQMSAALARLGSFLSEDDAAFVAFLVADLTSSQVAEAIAAYQTHPSEARPGSRKGAAARIVTDAVTSSYRNACLAVLPGFVSEADLPSLRQLVAATTSSRMVEALRQFFGSRSPGA